MLNMLEWDSETYCTWYSELVLLKVPWAHSSLGMTAFSFTAPNSWNALQSNLKMTALPTVGLLNSMISELYTYPTAIV